MAGSTKQFKTQENMLETLWRGGGDYKYWILCWINQQRWHKESKLKAKHNELTLKIKQEVGKPNGENADTWMNLAGKLDKGEMNTEGGINSKAPGN